MKDANEEIAELRAEVAALKRALLHQVAVLQATGEAVQGLILLHPQPVTLLTVFDALSEASQAPLLFSKVSDDALQTLDTAREALKGPLRSALRPPEQS